MVFNMSFIFNKEIEYADSPNLDAFGRLRVSEITSLIQIKHIYDKLPKQIDEVTGGTATSVFNQTNANVTMSVSSNSDYVIRQTLERGIYQPGKGQLFEASFSNFQLETNVIKKVGYFTSSTTAPYNTSYDGFFLESNGQTNIISFQIWKSGTLTYSAATTSWNNTKFNPNNISWDKTNLAFIDFQWLGVGRVRFGLNLSGVTYIFSDFSGTNNLTNVYMSSPNKPIRYEIRSVGGSGSFNQICSQVSMEGAINALNDTSFIVQTNSTTFDNVGTKYPFIGFKMNTNASDVTPYVDNVSILNTSNDNYLLTIEINPIISSAMTYTAIDSYVDASFGSNLQTVTTPGTILGGFIGEAGTQALTNFNLRFSEIKPGKKINGDVDRVWLCITPLGANANFIGSVNLYYYK
jgi:hypothetical protein